MDAAHFRVLALALPGATEGRHHGHADFRVGGKIFASLGPKEDWAMVKLTPEEQARQLAEAGTVFEPCTGAWGAGGATRVRLARARERRLRHCLEVAWRLTAPAKLLRELEGG